MYSSDRWYCITTFFDAFCSFGQDFVGPRFAKIYNVNQLIDELDHFGIEKALVSFTGSYGSDIEGMGPQNKSDNVSSMGQLINQSWEHTQGEIWNEIKDQDRLYECRRVLPQQHKGIDCEALKNNKIRGACGIGKFSKIGKEIKLAGILSKAKKEINENKLSDINQKLQKL